MGGGEGIDPFLSTKWAGIVLPERGGSPRNHAGPLPSTPTSPTGECPYFVSWGLWKEGTVHSASAGTRGDHDHRVTVLVVLLTLLIVRGWSESIAAQPIERPTDCTEAISIGTIFIGHDCGEWASVLISGNAIIREPWSRANRASRAVRLRERREGSPALVPPATVPDRNPDPDPLDGPLPADERNGNRGGTTVDGLDVELRCEATPEQTIITNNGGETVIVTEIRSLAGPPVAGEEGAPDPDLAIAPGQTRIYETGPGADLASGGISSPIYDNNRLSEEGARILTSTGESIEAPCASR
jgi:hypothetical protein